MPFQPRGVAKRCLIVLAVGAVVLPLLQVGCVREKAETSAPAAAGFAIAGFDSLRTFRENEHPAGGSATVRISAALGETEGFQVVVTNHTAAIMNAPQFAIEGLPGVKTTVDAQGSVLVSHPGVSTSAAPGRYFDLLRPAGWETVPANGFRPYWVDVSVPAQGVKPGTYRGTVTVTVNGESRQLPVELRVRGCQLPVTPSLKIAFAFGRSWMEEYYGAQMTAEQVRKAQDVMLDHRMGPLVMWGAGADFFNRETVQHCLNRGMNVFILTCGGKTDAQIEKSLESLKPKIDILQELGALDKTFLFGFDEILMSSPELVPSMRKAYEGFHALYPEIKRINTSWPDERLKGFVDIFVVPVANYSPSMAKGGEIWWYSVGADRMLVEPDFRIDFPGVLQRGFFTADWKVGVSGHLYWAVQREWPNNKTIKDKAFPENEWVTAYRNCINHNMSEDNGAGTLFYPDNAGAMLPTPRAKRIRDGIEDFEYLTLLKHATEQLRQKQTGKWETLIRDAEALLALPDTIVAASDTMANRWTLEGSSEQFSITFHPNALHSGRQALKIVPTMKEADAYQELKISAGTPYTVSGWIKTDDLTGHARLRAEYRDAQGNVLVRDETAPVSGSTGAKNFIHGTIALPDAPAAATTLRVSLTAVLTSSPQGKDVPTPKAFFDDIVVLERTSPLPLMNPGFEDKKLAITDNPAALLQYRDQVGDCLERCVQALGAR